MKINELLNNVKVEWKKLGEVCEIVTDYVAAGSFKTIADNVKYLDKPDYAQLIRTKDIKSKFQNSDTFVYVDKKAFNFLYRVNLNTECLILPNIGNCGEIYYIKPETLPYKNNVLGPNAIFVKSNSENNKFLYYLFLSIYFQKELYKITSKTGQGKFNKTELKEILIPIPPLEIQEKIVKILDKFTNYSAELQTELQLRTKQYEYYKNLFLSKNYLKKLCLKFGENPEIKTETLVEACETIKAGGDLPKEYIKSKEPKGNFIYPIYSNGIGNNALYGYSNSYKIDKKSVTISARGTIGYHEIREAFFTPIVRLIILIPNCEKITTEFLNYVLFTTNIENYVSGKSSISQLTIPNLKKVSIPIPPLKVQNEVVRILDKFSDISSNLEKGLPKEIDLRQKEYEFYRDLLLNFKKD